MKPKIYHPIRRLCFAGIQRKGRARKGPHLFREPLYEVKRTLMSCLSYPCLVVLLMAMASPGVCETIKRGVGDREVAYANRRAAFGKVKPSDESQPWSETLEANVRLAGARVPAMDPADSTTILFREIAIPLDDDKMNEGRLNLNRALDIDSSIRLSGEPADRLAGQAEEQGVGFEKEKQPVPDKLNELLDKFLYKDALDLLLARARVYPDHAELLKNIILIEFQIHKSNLRPVSNFHSAYLNQLEQIHPDSWVVQAIQTEKELARTNSSGRRDLRDVIREDRIRSERRSEKQMENRQARRSAYTSSSRGIVRSDLRHRGSYQRGAQGGRTVTKTARARVSRQGAAIGRQYRVRGHLRGYSSSPNPTRALRGRQHPSVVE